MRNSVLVRPISRQKLVKPFAEIPSTFLLRTSLVLDSVRVEHYLMTLLQQDSQ